MDFINKIWEKLSYLKSEYIYKNRIRRIHKILKIKNSSSDKNSILKHRNYWRQLKGNINTEWYKAYKFICNNSDHRFVPDNIYHNIIEANLNNRKIAYSYRCKNFYELYYKNENVFPEAIIRNIENFFYDRSYKFLIMNETLLSDILSNYKKIIIKPSLDSSGGSNIRVFKKGNGEFVNDEGILLSLEYLKKVYDKNYIIQNWIEQKPFFARFNPSSVNSIKVTTYRSVTNDEIIVLNTILRIGKKGNFVDNQKMGGLTCNIDKDYKLANYAVDIYGNKFYENNGVMFAQVGIVPNVEEMKQMAIRYAKKNFYSRLMGLDFCVDINGKVILIEINNQFGAISFQMNSGPLFGEHTDEIIQYFKNLKLKNNSYAEKYPFKEFKPTYT